MVLNNFLLILVTVEQGPTLLAVGADEGSLAIFMPRHKKWRGIMLNPPNF